MTAAVPPDVGELRRLEAVACPAPWAVTDGRSIVLRWPNHVAPLFQWANDPLEGAIGVRSVATTEFIAALRNSARWLLGQAEKVERVRERLAQSDWIVSAELLRILDESC